MYPGVAVLNSGVVPVPVLNRKCLRDRRRSLRGIHLNVDTQIGDNVEAETAAAMPSLSSPSFIIPFTPCLQT